MSDSAPGMGGQEEHIPSRAEHRAYPSRSARSRDQSSDTVGNVRSRGGAPQAGQRTVTRRTRAIYARIISRGIVAEAGGSPEMRP